MTQSNELAFAMLDPNGSYTQPGLTKREYFAAMAMQGQFASITDGWEGIYEDIAKNSVQAADALIEQLNKQP